MLQAELQAAIDAIEASGGADGRVFFTTARPADDAGKVGDVVFRRVAAGVSLYEKTGESTWTYRYDMNLLPTRPTLNARNGLGLFWDGNTLGWHEPPARYLELTVNTGLDIPAANETAVPFTYAATIPDSNENTGFLTRNANGNSITLAAGVYVLDMHIVISNQAANKRASLTIEIFDGTTILKQKDSIDYVRTLNSSHNQSVSTDFTFKLASTKNIQVRIKKTYEEGDTNLATVAGSTVTVRRV